MKNQHGINWDDLEAGKCVTVRHGKVSELFEVESVTPDRIIVRRLQTTRARVGFEQITRINAEMLHAKL